MPCAALRDSIKEVKGEATPFSITGSLPLVADLKREGFGAWSYRRELRSCTHHAHAAAFGVVPCSCARAPFPRACVPDLQIVGFGLSSTYHADNEYCLLSDMKNAVRVMACCVARLSE